MASTDYQNKSIDSLMQELANLGNRQILSQKTQLIAVQTHQNPNIHRFQTKSIPRKQFFKFSQHQKKYCYNQVYTQFNSDFLDESRINWQKGYNSTIMLENKGQHVQKLLKIVSKWTKNSLTFCIFLNQDNQIHDILGQRIINSNQLLENKRFYEIPQQKSLFQFLWPVLQQQITLFHDSLIDITVKNPQSFSQLHLTFLPQTLFSSQTHSPFSLIKSQLLQIVNYIKMNPSKRYEHICKMITKRLPMTNYLTNIFMSDSRNFVVSFIDSQDQLDMLKAKFQFYDKLKIVENILRRPDRHVIEIAVRKQMSNEQNNMIKRQNSLQERFKSPINQLSLKTQHQNEQSDRNITKPRNTSERLNAFESKQKQLSQKQFEFCRSLQRKTHKFSISPREHSLSKDHDKQVDENYGSPALDKKTLTKYEPLEHTKKPNKIELQTLDHTKTRAKSIKQPNFTQVSPVTQSQQITLLKAQHARQISQYHQTIQTLNKKIMILTKDLNLEQLYKVHEREIMLLQLKIKELRDDIAIMGSKQASENSLRAVIKRLNEEILAMEKPETHRKLQQGRFMMLEKELRETKEKLVQAEKTKVTFALEIQSLTKRLKIRDSELEMINREELQKCHIEQLAVNEQELLDDIQKLIQAVKNQERNSAQFLLRKISLILSDLSKYRDVILECNDFLVQLMEILDDKLGNKSPQIVLDCNKFIRSFLIENLAIF